MKRSGSGCPRKNWTNFDSSNLIQRFELFSPKVMFEILEGVAREAVSPTPKHTGITKGEN